MMNMNNEEFDRKMAFIVEQQAQFASDIQQLQESQTRTEQVVAQVVESVGQTNEVVTRLAIATHAGFTELNVKMNALIDAQIRTEENLKRTDENLKRTDEQLKRTDEQLKRTDDNLKRTDENVARTDASLKSLIRVVDRHLGGREDN